MQKKHPKCAVYLFEKAESCYESDLGHGSSGWRQRRPDYAWSFFLVGRDTEATAQLRKLIADIKVAITNPTSPLATSLISTTYSGNGQIDKSLDEKVHSLLMNVSGKPIGGDYLGKFFNEYQFLCFVISTNKF